MAHSVHEIVNGFHHFEIRIFETIKKNDVIVLVLPAMGVRATFYDLVSKVISSEVCSCGVIDWRGHGSSGISFKKGVDASYEDLVSDVYTSVVFLKEKFPDKRVLLLGHSLGGQIAAMTAARYSELVSGFMLNASCSPYKKGWNGLMRNAIVTAGKLFPFLAGIYGYFPGHKLGFGHKESVGVIQDWGRLVDNGNFNLGKNGFDYESGMSSYKGKVGGVVYKGDTSAPFAALHNLLVKFSNSKIVFQIELQHEKSNKKFNHYSWAKQTELSIPYIQKMVELISGL